MASLPPLPLPQGITSSYISLPSPSGLRMHILTSEPPPETANHGQAHPPLIVLCHGYPELAFSWRKIMPSLAATAPGYRVVAFDQRGYGRTTGHDTRPFAAVDMSQYTFLQNVTDVLCLVAALGHPTAALVVGHDFGATTAAACALARPDIFTACILMSHPFHGSPALIPKPKDPALHDPDVHTHLAQLDPPRKHYKWANATASAADEWAHPPQGMRAFLRGYMHLKSADWAANAPRPLAGWTAPQLAQLPEYYVMPLGSTMAEVVARGMAGEDARRTERWLSAEALDVYVGEWERTGFQGGLNFYRSTDPEVNRLWAVFAGRRIECPVRFVSGEKDWGNYQEPGALEGMQRGESVGDFRGVRMVEGAGHWPQQEQPEAVTREIRAFLGELYG